MKLDDIKGLVELMLLGDLSRLEIREGERHILLRRGHAPLTTQIEPAMLATLPTMQQAPVKAAAAAPAPTPAPAVAAGESETLIRSPMVGTFYSAPDPESPPFVKIGDAVGPESVVCLVEAMKVFNEIKAEASGRVARVLVKNGEAVEYDQPLFALTAG